MPTIRSIAEEIERHGYKLDADSSGFGDIYRLRGGTPEVVFSEEHEGGRYDGTYNHLNKWGNIDDILADLNFHMPKKVVVGVNPWSIVVLERVK